MSHKLRVLHVLYRLVRGGAEHGTANTLISLRELGVDARLVVFMAGQGNKLEADLHAHGVPVTFLDKKPGFQLPLYFKLHKVIQSFAPDILHTHMDLLRYALPPALCARVPVIVHTLHTTAPEEAVGIERWLRHRTFGSRVHPIGLTQAIRQSAMELYGISDCAQIFNGVWTGRFARNDDAQAIARQELGFAPDALVFVCVARLAEMKNHRLLLSAFASLAAGNEKAMLVLVGSGPLSDELKAQAEDLGIQANVRFAGQQDDVRPYLWAADVALLASTREGQGQALCEAMAAGNPLVCTDTGGMPEVNFHGSTGLVVPSGDEDAFAAALQRMADEPELRQSFADAGVKRANEMFDYSVMGKKHLELYERLLKH